MARKKTETVEETEDQAPAEEPKAAPVKSGLVTVHNPQVGHFVQPTSGIRIGGHETRELKDDGWLGLQVRAGVLEKV